MRIVYDIRAPRAPVLQPPAGVAPQRRDGLWQYTCCELFMAAANGDGGYVEFNFSPSGDWAAYVFDAPRQGMRPFLWPSPEGYMEVDAGADFRKAPYIRQVSSVIGDPSSSGSLHRVRVEVDLPAPLPSGDFRLAPTVVLETEAGVSHWAARHPAQQPDFHHPAGFSDPLPLVWGSTA